MRKGPPWPEPTFDVTTWPTIAPYFPTLPVIHPTVRNAWANWSPRDVRAGARLHVSAMGLVVAIS